MMAASNNGPINDGTTTTMPEEEVPPQARRVQQLRAQVDETREIMTANVERILARGERLEDLLDKSVDLEANSSRFRATARRVERHMCWKNAKCNCIIASIVLVIVAVLIVVILYETGMFKGSGSGGGSAITTTTTTKSAIATISSQ